MQLEKLTRERIWSAEIMISKDLNWIMLIHTKKVVGREG